ncbi:leucine-rich repeat receptor protein kinase HPCA1-like isoform X2 [Prosopis cineraria]|uniref:leucine-rich repeat receptor protein kinase HPCA1-like isoform X2 n=1 Tax=Prosopis cineraria TaxID=364024 RepID=UPI0024103698|nr:leucine-rich repeat receptor protein kinase HPCA1-like isoform X2 [Prosopis cineraria]
MGGRILVFILLVCNYLLIAVADTATEDLTALKSLMDTWQKTPPNWVGSDPCNGWDGIKCTNSHVISISLSSTGLAGQLSGYIGSLSELETLDLAGPLPQTIGNLKKLSTLILVGCSFNGPIPEEIGNLQELLFLSLNSNKFVGHIPPSIGNLSNLYWLDLADNQLEGPIPVSSSSKPGLDMLHHAKHFHCGNNNLSGPIPPKLFSSEMNLIHVLFENNQLSGSIPTTLGLVQSLEVVRLDSNSLSGLVPQNISSLVKVQEMYLSNNKLSGSLPNLIGMSVLSYMDVSNNSFTSWDFPSWLSTMQSLTTLKMENTQLQGQISSSFFGLPSLQAVALKGNELNGTLDIGTTYSSQLRFIDLRGNQIDQFRQSDGVPEVKIMLKGNPICEENGMASQNYCSDTQANDNLYKTPFKNCDPGTCSLEQIPSPNCQCSYPYTGALVFRAPSFSDLENNTHYTTLEESLMHSFQSHELPVASISLSHPIKDSDQYLELSLQVFPSNQDRFNRTGTSSIGFLLSNQTFKPPKEFGPFYFNADRYEHFGAAGPSKSSNTGVIIGAAVGGSILLVLLILAGVYACFQKKRAERAIDHNNPFRRWDSESTSGFPQLKGARQFSFDEIKKYTSNFSQANNIGTGDYGKVYKGTLPNGQLVAIKRAQKESVQGAFEFKAEIELLSRVHHKNLVGLLGFCFEKREQMLVYEHVSNGSLKDTLSGKSGFKLDWIRRLKIALGTARGLAYLHEHANPPIIHRDIKSNNILLDERLNAKVADFGLSKSMVDTEKDHITTQVKGTLGYLDPEYYMSQQLTEKSDVYSFGVLLMELITARKPIERGKYIVKEIKSANDKTKNLCGLYEFLDPTMDLGSTLIGFEVYVNLALKCVEESGDDRPRMSDVVKQIENLLLLAGANPNAESASTSASYEDISKGSSRHPYSNESLDTGVVLPNPKIEPM